MNYQGEGIRGDNSCALALALDMQFFELADLLIANGADVNLEIGRSDEYKNASSSLLSRHYFNSRASAGSLSAGARGGPGLRVQ